VKFPVYADPACAVAGGVPEIVMVRPTIRIDRVDIAAAPLTSVTLAVNDATPALVGAPVIAPLWTLSEIPGGRLPCTIDQVYGETPLVTDKFVA
jgi:hypothetical protein